MAFQIQTVEYFYVSVKDQPSAAYDVLSSLADMGINLMAFSAVPMGPSQAQLTVFPQDFVQLRLTALARPLNQFPFLSLICHGIPR